MKKGIFLFVLFSIFSTTLVFAEEKDVPLKGGWGKGKIRTLIPAPPAVYINENVLSIYLADPLDDLKVVITDSDGNIVYQDTISGTQPGHTITLQEIGQEEYTITLTHNLYGYLTGWF